MLNCLASLAIQQAFSKPCLVNMISKDTILVFSFYWDYRLLYGNVFVMVYALVVSLFYNEFQLVVTISCDNDRYKPYILYKDALLQKLDRLQDNDAW